MADLMIVLRIMTVSPEPMIDRGDA